MASLGAVAAQPHAKPQLKAAKHGDNSARSLIFLGLLWLALAFSVLVLITLLVDSFIDGMSRLDGNLFTKYTSSLNRDEAGARAAILGSMWVMATTAILALPLGVAAGLYLEEFADKRKWYNRLIEVNLSNLAAVPAIVYGLLTAAFCLFVGLERRFLLSGGIALALLILPVLVIATREAVRAVPQEIRQGSLALGATPLQTTWRQTLPAAVPGIATGAILALSRAFGEAAPLLLLGSAAFIASDPEGPLSSYTVLPIQIFNWSSQPQEEFHQAASAAIIVMLVLLLMMNAVAILIRNRYQKRW